MQDQDKQAQHDKVNELEETIQLVAWEHQVILDRLREAKEANDPKAVSHWEEIEGMQHRLLVQLNETRDREFEALYN